MVFVLVGIWTFVVGALIGLTSFAHGYEVPITLAILFHLASVFSFVVYARRTHRRWSKAAGGVAIGLNFLLLLDLVRRALSGLGG